MARSHKRSSTKRYRQSNGILGSSAFRAGYQLGSYRKGVELGRMAAEADAEEAEAVLLSKRANARMDKATALRTSAEADKAIAELDEAKGEEPKELE